jgi:hypothetical protein
MTTGNVHYLPGTSICVAGSGAALVTDLAATSAAVTACWAALRAGQDADALAEIVRREVPAGSARVALAGRVGTAVRVLLGGEGAHALVAASAAEAAELLAPPSTWLDERFPEADAVRVAVTPLRAGASDVDGPLPIDNGIVLAAVALVGSVEASGAVLPAADPEPPAPWPAPEAFGAAESEPLEPPPEPIMEASGVAPTVLAVSCPDGHLGPPYDQTCRICGAPMPAQGPFSAPRPPLGVLELSSGTTVRLDRDVVLGRAPSVGAATPLESVHLVRVPSPNNDISRNHARVSLEGWQVLVTDLGSTNGTTLRVPGADEPVQLRPHDAVPIVPGTVLALADEVEIRFDPRG